MLAVTLGRDVGIDVELVRPVADLEQLARGCFSPRERAALASLPIDQRTQAFFLGWTRKEAIVKAAGIGLGGPLERISVSIGPGEPARIVELDASLGPMTRWSLVHFAPSPDAVAALAVVGDTPVSSIVWIAETDAPVSS